MPNASPIQHAFEPVLAEKCGESELLKLEYALHQTQIAKWLAQQQSTRHPGLREGQAN